MKSQIIRHLKALGMTVGSLLAVAFIFYALILWPPLSGICIALFLLGGTYYSFWRSMR